jgi:hypothetical protein
MPNFDKTLTAFGETVVARINPHSVSRIKDGATVVRFLSDVHSRMPDYLRLPMRLLLLAFDAAPLTTRAKPFHRLNVEARLRHMTAWENSRIEAKRRLIEFYGTLAIYCYYSELYGQDYGKRMDERND